MDKFAYFHKFQIKQHINHILHSYTKVEQKYFRICPAPHQARVWHKAFFIVGARHKPKSKCVPQAPSNKPNPTGACENLE